MIATMMRVSGQKAKRSDFEFVHLWEGKPIDPRKFDFQDRKEWNRLEKRVCEIINEEGGTFSNGDELFGEGEFYGIRVYWK